MTIYLATDHAGFELKEKIKVYLMSSGFEVKDFGAFSLDKDDDYPDFIKLAAEAVAEDSGNVKAIVLGGSGQGEAMVANRYKGVRAAVYYGAAFVKTSASQGSDPFAILKLSREHNNANVLSLGARFLSDDEALAAVKVWLATDFSGEERHVRRIAKF